jgi:hypothetical protein
MSEEQITRRVLTKCYSDVDQSGNEDVVKCKFLRVRSGRRGITVMAISIGVPIFLIALTILSYFQYNHYDKLVELALPYASETNDRFYEFLNAEQD